MVPVTHLYLVRHGETAWHAEGRYPGQANPVLNDEGEAQAYRLAALMNCLSMRCIRAISHGLGTLQSGL